ncbi:polysaccharide deacetylase family protein [Curvibacter sp. APW13]|uniref:polysaccharide deacetylase family protein n=1 Tax=Curvibacter sp. APW13 TaxID=3077236 RepID=UPI0028DF2933|nr:polysaccharide deacetylase family protein [Curvibacter sp. APW13]MDT8990060.1 polysaccharide deacetylase family protein [Curvibacter sp. APW13]
MKAGLEGSSRSAVWEGFLRKYRIPYVRITSVDLLEQTPANAVLLLPSNVALSDREMAAIRSARERGASVLSTWLTGVRNDSGDWRGFEFMEKVLGVRVAGNTEDGEDDNFLIVHGDNPVTHAIPAGTRVWIERVKDMLPLRLVAKNYAAHIMDWSRTFSIEKKTGAIVFDEEKQGNGSFSRSVTFGYPEQVWLSGDPKMLEALAHNALAWLFRQPDAYLAAWPHPHASAALIAVEGGEDVAEVDFEFAKRLETAGAKATYYVLSDSLAKAAPVIKRIQKRGHEIAYFGDKFDGFKDQSRATQAKRMDAMQKGLDDAGIKLTDGGGFVAPMDSYDKVTEELLLERGIGHYLSFMDATDSRLPFFAKGTTDVNKATVVLPRTQPGPEEATEEGDPDEGMQNFLSEFALSESMGGLSVIRIPTQTILSEPHRELLFGHLAQRKGKMWMTSAGEIAQWWRDRARVAVRLEPNAKAPILVVSVQGGVPVRERTVAWLNLPSMASRLRLEAADLDDPTPPVVKVDAWRSGVVLDGLVPGEYCWYLYFDGPSGPAKN